MDIPSEMPGVDVPGVPVMAKPTLKHLASLDSGKWYDVRTTYGSSGSAITAKKTGCKGRFFLAWTKEDLMRDVHYGERCPE